MTVMVRASGIRGYLATMQSLGVDPQALLHRYRISMSALEDDNALLSQRAVVHLLEASATVANCPDLGLRISNHQDISILGTLGVALQNAVTVKDALGYASRFMFLHGSGLSISFNDASTLVEDSIELVVEIKLKGHPAQRQTIDLILGTTHRISQWLVGKQYQLNAVTVPHSPLAPLNVYRRFFGVPVIANKDRAALHIGRATLLVKPQGANPALREITEDYLSRHFRVPGDAVSARVRQALRQMLGTPQANKVDIAAMLAIHPRTLQRRLESEGTSFEAIKDDVRKETALRFLRETQVPLSQLSGLLGFPEQSALTRACRRWFNTTPSALRRREM